VLTEILTPFVKSFLSILLKAILFFIIIAIVGVKTAGLMTFIAVITIGDHCGLQIKM